MILESEFTRAGREAASPSDEAYRMGETAVTALSEPPPPETAGVVWTLQDVPLKNSTSGPLVLAPTATKRRRSTGQRRR